MIFYRFNTKYIEACLLFSTFYNLDNVYNSNLCGASIQGWSDNIQWPPAVFGCHIHWRREIPTMVAHWWSHNNSTATHGAGRVSVLLVSPCTAPSLPLFTVPLAPPCIHSHRTYYLWVHFFFIYDLQEYPC